VALAAPLALVGLWPWSPLTGVVLLAVSHALVLYPTLRPNAQWLGPVVTHFATDQREVWLTIDDGPASDTGTLLDLFDARGVKATFFVKGKLVTADRSIARQIVERGHSLGNHSHTHPSATFWCLLPRRIAREIDDCSSAIASVNDGKSASWFRAPVGMKNPAVHPALDRRGMRLIGWTSRAFDAVQSDVDRITARIVRDLRPGAILVLHQGKPHSVEVFERVIDAAIDRGYEFVIPEDDQLRAG
jgi:peptidoglycan-N-acetylglucosamine deacetylase